MPPKKTASVPKKAAACAKALPVKKAAPGGKKPVTKKVEPAAPQKVKVKAWTKEDEAARKIQTSARGFVARRKLAKLRKEKESYDELMDKLEKDALVQVALQRQKEAEEQRAKEDEERRRKAEMRKRVKRMHEAAFDGDEDEMTAILKEVTGLDDNAGIGHDMIGSAMRAKHQLAMVDCADVHGNTPISEAASGGSEGAIKLLIERGADLNTQGQFQRTPLYRAAFAGHLGACQILLQYGGDPRICAEDGQNPGYVASIDQIRDLFENWDISQTLSMLESIEGEKDRRKEVEQKRREAEQVLLEDEIAEVEKELLSAQKRLTKCYCEVNKRIEEHDQSAALGFDKPEITERVIHDAETDLEVAKIAHDEISSRLAAMRFNLREKKALATDGAELPGLKIRINELVDVLFRDVGDKIKNSGRWPLIIDTSARAVTFLRYQDTNYINALSPASMEPDKLRLALLGAIRYGKPAVFDMMEVDMMQILEERLNELAPNLFASVMDKSIIENDKFAPLIKESDGPAYCKNNFNNFRMKNFKFVIVTKCSLPSDSLLEQTYPVRIFVPDDT